jgi:hypothetical protein
MSAHIKTWQERSNDDSRANRRVDHMHEYMRSEIAELRAALADETISKNYFADKHEKFAAAGEALMERLEQKDKIISEQRAAIAQKEAAAPDDLAATPKSRIMCECKGASDYCAHCGNEPNGTVPCRVLWQQQLDKINRDDVVVFGCKDEVDDVEAGLGSGKGCKKWCGKTGCPFTLKTTSSAALAQPVAVDAAIGAVLAYDTKGHNKPCGQMIGANGAGQFVVIFHGTSEQGNAAAREHIRSLERSGYRFNSCLVVDSEEGYHGPVITHVNAAIDAQGKET